MQKRGWWSRFCFNGRALELGPFMVKYGKEGFGAQYFP